MSKFLPEAVEAAKRHKLPVPLVQALLIEISGAKSTWVKKDPQVRNHIALTSERTGIKESEIIETFEVTSTELIPFKVRDDLWRNFSKLQSIPTYERLWLSCDMGISMLPLGQMVLSGKISQSGTWQKNVESLMRSVDKQIDLLLFELDNLSKAKYPAKKEAGMMLAISRWFDSGTASVTQKAHAVLARAKALEPEWQKVLDAERESKRGEARALGDSVKETISGAGDTPKGEDRKGRGR